MAKLSQKQVKIGMQFEIKKIADFLVMDANKPGYIEHLHQNAVVVGDVVEITRAPKRDMHGINLVYWKNSAGVEYASYWSTFKSSI